MLPGTDATIEDAIAAAKPTELEAHFYRSVNFARMHRYKLRLLDGTHAGITGGRYNPPYSEPIAYFAGSQTIASFECEQLSLIGTPVGPAAPRLIVAVSVHATVLDLTNPIVFANLGVRREELLVPTLQWQRLNREGKLAPSQLLGAIARRRLDLDGLRVPSWVVEMLPERALPREDNLVLFMDPACPTRPRSAAMVRVHDPTGLIP